jgi:hypothetical protein
VEAEGRLADRGRLRREVERADVTAAPRYTLIMTPLAEANALFREAGLPVPAIPPQLAARLEQREPWCYATRELDHSPYDWRAFVDEADPAVSDYAVLAHAGHGANSYAIHYYLVHGPLRLFLQLGWGGVYMDAAATTRTVHDCFRLADQLDAAIPTSRKIPPGASLLIAASDLHGSTWRCVDAAAPFDPTRMNVATLLAEVLAWATT